MLKRRVYYNMLSFFFILKAKMNFYKLFIVCFISSISYAQYDVNLAGNTSPLNNSGLWVVSNLASENTEGSLYLFDNWSKKGQLVMVDDRKFSILGLNYDTKSDAFVVKVANDSIFMFDNSKLKEVKIGSQKFKKYNAVDGKNTYLEVLAVSNDIEFLKYHGKKLKLGNVNPLTQVSEPDTYIDFNKIYYKKATEIKEIKLIKKKFCNLFEDKANEIKKFISKNKISLKDERNLQKILNYHNTL